jgi:hypothetical protein
VAQNHDLELALNAAAGEQTQENAEEPVQQTGEQDAQSERSGHDRQHHCRGRIEFSLPHRVFGVTPSG